MRKLLFIIFVFAGLGKSLFSQDIHFSQYYATPLTLNPALTGHYLGDWRAMGIYRSQWRSISIPYVTQGLGFDKQLYIYKEHLSWGLSYINDQSGNISLVSHQIYGSFAYHKKLPDFHILHMGIQAGYVIKSYNLGNQTFPEQWDFLTGGFNSAFPTNEPNSFDQPSYFDLNAGFSWSRKYTKAEPLIGASFFHLTQPKISYTGSDNQLPLRLVFHGEVKIDLSKKFALTPRAYFTNMRNVNSLATGLNATYFMPANALKFNSVWFGTYLRNGYNRNMDAVYCVVGLNYNNFDIGFSYDINISKLKVASNNRGAFELSVIYTAPSTRLDKTYIPCDRY